MANHMECNVQITGLTPAGIEFLQELFKPEGDQYDVGSDILLKRLYGSTDEQIDERKYCIENIGSKWVNAYLEYAEDDQAQISSTSAWSVPYQMYLQLSKKLVEVSPKAIITGTYEDEGFDPCGAFIIADNYDDIEDVFGTDDIDHDLLWADDDYRDSITEELHNEVQRMISGYREYLQEIIQES